MVYTESGGTDVLHMTERPVPEPGRGEVRVRVRFSAVNPTDVKSRQATTPPAPQVPNQDGSGLVDAIGPGVTGVAVGDPVWVWDAAYQRPDGTAQEQVVLPQQQVVRLPDGVPLEVGASLGVPARTAHRCLTVAEWAPAELAPGALAGRAVLVSGGAGAVGHAAIQLARWAGARVIATVSTPDKAALAEAAGAHHVVSYRDPDAADQIRGIVPGGVDAIVEVAAAANATLDTAVVGADAAIAIYAGTEGDELIVPVRAHMAPNTRFQFVLLYTEPDEAKRAGVRAVTAAAADGALPVGREAGLPLHVFALEQAAQAHAAVEAGTTGKVLIEVG